MKYCLLLWSHLSLQLFLIFQSRGYLITRASSCPTYCGDTLIPYPFGIGDGCYLDEWFEIQCNNSTLGKLIAYLPKIKKEVVSINLPNPKFENSNSLYPYGKLRIKTSITSTGCSTTTSSNRSRLDGEVLNFTGSPFTIGPNNILVAVGCDNEATVTKLDAKLVGCMSSCKYNGEYKSNCNGDRCCQADIPVTQRGYDYSIDEGEIAAVEDGIQVIGVSIGELMANQTGRGSCRVAFLTDEFSKYPESILTNPMWFHNQTYATVQLRWVFPKMNLSFIKSLGCEPRLFGNQEIIKDMTCQCKRISQQSDMIGDPLNSTGGSCKCSRGYEGNPFLPGGCTDINECKLFASDGKSKYCSGCVNTPGSFHCRKKGIKILKIIIGFIGGFGMLIFTSTTFWLFKFIERRRKINRKKKYFKRNGGLLLQQQLISKEGNVEKTKVFNSKELEKATENFSSTRVLGEGGQGTVYKGMLVDGRIVAIKKSKVKDEDKIEEFINEVVILSEINHRNIVKLLGCCLETEVPLLVYEFIPNGNLFEHLHDESDDYTLATWEMRLRIALDIAEAVSYLHSAAASPIYHRDIKTMNIMLDEKYRAKVSDFGTSRSVTVDHTHLTTLVSGTAGYLDPEYYQSSQFTDKSDVYSFGVVLVELITGQQPISVMRSPENKNLVTYFNLAMKENKLVDIIDPRIRDGCKLEQVIATAQLAKRCLNLSGKRRPNMRAVAMELERIRSPNGNSQSHAQVVEDDEDEVAVEINIVFESYDNAGVTAPSVLQYNASSTSYLDAEPLFPRQTW